MAWFLLVSYALLLGALCSIIPSYLFGRKHLFAVNIVFISMATYAIVKYEEGQIEGEPMYLIAYLIMLAISTSISQLSYYLSNLLLKRE
jgi:hypothetical protein